VCLRLHHSKCVLVQTVVNKLLEETMHGADAGRTVPHAHTSNRQDSGSAPYSAKFREKRQRDLTPLNEFPEGRWCECFVCDCMLLLRPLVYILHTYSTLDAPPPDLLAPLTAPSTHLFLCGFLPPTSRTPPLSIIVGGVGGNRAGVLKEVSSRVLSRDNEAPYSRKFAATTAQGRLHKAQKARGETDR